MSERIDTTARDELNSDEGIRQLLREVGPRDLPAAQLMNEVRQAVQEEWQSLVDRRRRRNRTIGYALAAGIAALVVAVAINMQLAPVSAGPIADVARVDGDLQVAVDGAEQWRTVAAGETLAAGAMLRTDEGTRAALNVGGVSVRLDAATRVELESAQRIVLERGGVYVDADPAAQATQALLLETPYGSVRHLGTQYQLRTERNGIEVSVREGRVEIAHGADRYQGAAGERISIAAQGEVQRAVISPRDESWGWAASIAPVFDIERRPLSQFLEWVARETGKQIVYATPEVQARAQQLILRGSVNNLAPELALAAVLATTPFTHADTGAAIQIRL